MLNRKLRILLIIIITIVLKFTLTPAITNLFLDVVPTNANVPIKEFVSKIVPEGTEYSYIYQDNYLVALAYDRNTKILQNYFALKGKRSGFIDTTFSVGSGVYARKYSETKILNGKDFLVYVVKHKWKYLITVSTFENDVVLFDDNDSILDSIQQGNKLEFIDVVGALTEEYKIYMNINGDEIVVLDYDELSIIFE